MGESDENTLAYYNKESNTAVKYLMMVFLSNWQDSKLAK
jgi:hypothetical protein